MGVQFSPYFHPIMLCRGFGGPVGLTEPCWVDCWSSGAREYTTEILPWDWFMAASLPFLSSSHIPTPPSCLRHFVQSDILQKPSGTQCVSGMVFSAHARGIWQATPDHALQWRAARITHTPLGTERFPKRHGQVSSGVILLISASSVF